MFNELIDQDFQTMSCYANIAARSTCAVERSVCASHIIALGVHVRFLKLVSAQNGRDFRRLELC